MKIKTLKKVIAAFCAATMMATATVSNAGAIKKGFYYGEKNRSDVEERVENTSECISDCMTKIVNLKRYLKGKGVNCDEAINNLEDLYKLLKSTKELNVAHFAILSEVENSVKSLSSNIDGIENNIEEDCIKDINKYLVDETSSLKMSAQFVIDSLTFADELDRRRYKLYEMKKVVISTSTLDNVKKAELKSCIDDATAYYGKIVSKIELSEYVFNEKDSVNQKSMLDEFLKLEEEAINKFNDWKKKILENKASDVQNNIHLPGPLEPDDINKESAPMVGEKENLNSIKEEEEKKENERIREQARKDVERELKEMDERRKREEEEAKKQAEEQANKKEKLKQEESRLEEESKILDEKAKAFENFKAIYDRLYNGEELPVIERLVEIGYKLQEVRSELLYMDMPEIFDNMKKKFENNDEEKALVRKKFEINRKYVNLSNELRNMAFLRGEGFDVDNAEIDRNIKASERAMNEINEINKKIKKEIERKNEVNREIARWNTIAK